MQPVRAADQGRTTAGALTSEERQQILRDWNDTTAPYPAASTIHQLVAAQADRTPEAPAVLFEDAVLTYRELDDRADQLALRLRELGVGPGVLVALLVPRSLEMMVAIIGILKSGGAYVPLEPSYPPPRLAFMMEDSQAPVVVTRADVAGLVTDDRARVICLGAGGTSVTSRLDEPVVGGGRARDAGPDDLAYVIYTSGSTGRPKGVEICHRSVVNLMASMARAPGLHAGQVLAALTTPAFDLSVPDLYLPLVTGALMVIVGPEVASDGRRLAAALDECRADLVQATPTTWRMLLEAGWVGRPGIKAVCGGEALPEPLADALLSLRIELWNMYGPTEATVWTTAARMSPGGGPPGIGAPLANATAYVLDPELNPVSVGHVGELHVGGLGLARGYRGRPELTAERFIPHPFDAAPGARVYKTGDLARWRADGTLECLGRLDHQVKIRGFRIELGEIEARLQEHPGVATAAVVARQDPPGGTRLVAYVVPRRAPPTVTQLRRHLSEHLPHHMVPGAFVFLNALPLTPNGKVDRAALPAPGARRPDMASRYQAPRSPPEESLAAIWSRVLSVEPIGVDDDFFDLGGDSLRALEMVSLLEERLGTELPLQAVFDAPTVADLARRVLQLSAGQEPVPELVRTGASRAPLSLAQEAMWALKEAAPSGFYNASHSFDLVGTVDDAALLEALRLVVHRHSALRTCFPADAPEPYQQIAAECPVEVGLTDLRSLPSPDAFQRYSELLPDLCFAPFDVTRTPLFRAVLHLLDDARARLVLVCDHLIVDGDSLRIIADEVQVAYDALSAGAPPPLRPPAIGYEDFCLWQRQRFSALRLDQERDYWRGHLAGMAPRPILPSDRQASAEATDLTDYVYFTVPGSGDEMLRDLARSTQSTSLAIVLALPVALLGRYTDEQDIVVRTVFSGRDHPMLQGVVGNFANVAFLRTDLSGDPSFATLARRAQTTVVGMLENSHVPFTTVFGDVVGDLRRRGIDGEPEIPVFVEYDFVEGGPPDSDALNTGPRPKLFPTLNALGFDFNRDGHFLWGSLAYHVELFDRTRVEGIVADLMRVLLAVSEDPGLRLSHLPISHR